MKYPTAFLSLLLFACGSCVPKSVPDEPPTLIQPSVGKLEVLDPDGDKLGTCTGLQRI